MATVRLTVHEEHKGHRAQYLGEYAMLEHLWQCDCGEMLCTERGPGAFRDPKGFAGDRDIWMLPRPRLTAEQADGYLSPRRVGGRVRREWGSRCIAEGLGRRRE